MECLLCKIWLSPVQFKLLGINAHINRDIWQALTTEFSLQELMENMASYLRFEKGRLKVYHEFYNESFEANGKIRLLSFISGRLENCMGSYCLINGEKGKLNWRCFIIPAKINSVPGSKSSITKWIALTGLYYIIFSLILLALRFQKKRFSDDQHYIT
jgi:hypothetical protein